MQEYNRNFFKKLWKLTKLYWQSEEKWRARFLLTIIVGLNLGHVYLLVLLNEWNNTFYNSLQNHDQSGFFSALGDFSILAFFYIVVAVYELYLQQMLEIKWRRWLTAHYLRNWLSRRTFYYLQVLKHNTDNPDQRISEDLRLFVADTLNLALGILKAAVTLVSFVAILWNLSGTLTMPLGQSEVSIPGYMVWVAIVYAIVGTWLTSKIGRPLVHLNFYQQRYEADFRFSLVRLRENSESIALYAGEQQEGTGFAARFKNVFDNYFQLMRRQKRLTWFTSGYAQIAVIFPFLVAAPRYFNNQMQLGGLIQTASAFGRVQDALSYFIESYSLLAEWQAVVNRLIGFVDSMEQVRALPKQGAIRISHGTEPLFAVKGLNVALPDGKRLLENLEFQLKTGDSLLITGPSGCGKSTLMRTLAGIWPFGQGSISIPQNQKLLFLPQKPYLPLGTLRDVLLYPYGTGAIPDETIRKTMAVCNLGELAGQLDRTENWSQILSLGEQQRIAFIRALLQRPEWLFLDEATSALDEPSEQAMYELLQKDLKASAIVSIGHRSTLRDYHKLQLNLQDSGRWNLKVL